MTSWLKRSMVRCGSAQVPPSLQDPAGAGRRSHFIQLLRVGAVWVVAASDKPMIVLSPAFYKEAAAGGAFFGIGQYAGIVYCVVTAGKVRATDKSFSVFTDFKQVSCLASGTFGLPLILCTFDGDKANGIRLLELLKENGRIFVFRKDECPVFSAGDCDIEQAPLLFKGEGAAIC